MWQWFSSTLRWLTRIPYCYLILTSYVQEPIFLTKGSIKCLTRTPNGYPTF
jgi:hypothetical protein